MNFQMVKQSKNQKDGKGYGVKLEMFGVINSIKEVKMTSNNKPMTKCEVADDNNESHTITFFGDDQPAVNMIGKRFAMSVSCEDYKLQDGRTVETYQGFLRSGNVNQNVPQSTQQASQDAPQSTTPPNTVGNADIRTKAAKIAALAIGGTGVDEASEIATKIIDTASLLIPWLESGQLPTFATPKPQSFEQQYNLPPEQ